MIRLLPLLLCLFWSCSRKKSNALEIDSSMHKEFFLQESQVSLASPSVKIDSIFFRNSATVMIDFELEDAEIMCSLNGKEAKKYKQAISIEGSSTFSVVGTKQNYLPSEIQEFKLLRVSDNFQKAKIEIQPNPNDKYIAEGKLSLIDLKKGSLQFLDENRWLGFQDSLITIKISFPEPKHYKKVYISLLNDHKSWIFQPEKISCSSGSLNHITKCFLPEKKSQKANLNIVELDFGEIIKSSELKIWIKNFDEIPEWHPGKGSSPWLFIDEIIVE